METVQLDWQILTRLGRLGTVRVLQGTIKLSWPDRMVRIVGWLQEGWDYHPTQDSWHVKQHGRRKRIESNGLLPDGCAVAWFLLERQDTWRVVILAYRTWTVVSYRSITEPNSVLLRYDFYRRSRQERERERERGDGWAYQYCYLTSFQVSIPHRIAPVRLIDDDVI